MEFVKKSANQTPIVDTVFAVVELAQQAKEQFGKEKVVDATIGSLYSEDNQLVAMESVFSSYDALPSIVKAKYASDFTGNDNYRKQVEKWVLDGRCQALYKKVIATPGGTGAISSSFDVLLDINETVIIPNIAWGSYALMAQTKQLQVETYSMFEDNHFNLGHLKEVCQSVMKQQGKVVVVINDPCHNPTGYSMSEAEWKNYISFMNELSKDGPCVIINDIAYIDYAYTGKNARSYLDAMNEVSDQVMVIIAFSCSKSLTSYGLRLGAAMIMGKNEKDVRSIEIVMEKAARSIWSNVANAAMENFVQVTTTHNEAYEAEKQEYINLLKQRSQIFVREANENQLLIYPYHEGFFVTVVCEDNKQRDRYHELLIQNLIFTVKVNLGIRVAICSLSVEQCYGLAKRMKDLLVMVDE